jgi:TPR repeat protein
MSRILCVAVVMSGALLSWAGPAVAGMNEGVAAVTVGDYTKAIAEFQPLAASGDAAAQYQLAKIYLEGHGPADGVPQGIDLMTKSANSGYPEAQAQLGLMYAMGLGVSVDNAKAYDWLSKAVTQLPEGTRRTVAEANRDAVLKRMNGGKTPTVAATTGTVTPKPATTEETVAKPAATPAKPVAETTAAKPAATQTATATTTATSTATTTPTTTATTAKPASDTAAKTPDTSTQVASAKAPDAAPAAATTGSQSAAQSGVRIQLASLPSEELAWKAWKDMSGKYSTQLTGLTAIVQPADLGAKGTFYRVQTGPFDTVAKAQERCSAMKQAGLDCLVVGKP